MSSHEADPATAILTDPQEALALTTIHKHNDSLASKILHVFWVLWRKGEETPLLAASAEIWHPTIQAPSPSPYLGQICTGNGANLQAQPLVKHDLSLDHDCESSAGNELEKRISLALERVASGSGLCRGRQHQHRSNELGQESFVYTTLKNSARKSRREQNGSRGGDSCRSWRVQRAQAWDGSKSIKSYARRFLRRLRHFFTWTGNVGLTCLTTVMMACSS